MTAVLFYVFFFFFKRITYTFKRVSARIMYVGIKLKSILLTIATETQFAVFVFVKSRNTFSDEHWFHKVFRNNILKNLISLCRSHNKTTCGIKFKSRFKLNKSNYNFNWFNKMLQKSNCLNYFLIFNRMHV